MDVKKLIGSIEREGIRVVLVAVVVVTREEYKWR